MITIKIKVPNTLQNKIRQTETSLNKNINSAIKKSAYLVQATTVKNIQRGNKTGLTYKRRSITHQASAPGEYPASDTGRLAASFEVRTANLYAIVQTNIKYAKFLVNMNRLLLEASLEKNRERIQILIDEAIKKSLEE